MAGFLAGEAARIPERRTRPKDILEQDYWYEEEVSEDELDIRMTPPHSETSGSSNDQVVPGRNGDKHLSLGATGVITNTIQLDSVEAAQQTQPRMLLEDLVTYHRTTRPRLLSSVTSRRPQDSLSNGSSSTLSFSTRSVYQPSTSGRRQQLAISGGQLNSTESLVIQSGTDGSTLPSEDPHAAYTRLASRYFDEPDEQQEVPKSPKGKQPTSGPDSIVGRLQQHQGTSKVSYKAKTIPVVSRRIDNELARNTVSKAKRARIDRVVNRNPVKFQPPGLDLGTLSLRDSKAAHKCCIVNKDALQETSAAPECGPIEFPDTPEPPGVLDVSCPKPTAELHRSPLEPNFIIDIRLDDEERKHFGKFRYLYEAAARKLNDPPPFPQGLQPFPMESIRLRLDATPAGTERKLLLQLLCAGVCTRALLTAWPTPTDELPAGRPAWASLPANLPRTFLEQLAGHVRGRNMIVVFPSARISEHYRLSEELRHRHVPCKFFSEPPSWEMLNEDGVLLVPSTRTPIGHRQRVYDGVLLPPGIEPWPENICGSLTTESDLPSKYQPPVARTAFVSESLATLITRLERVPADKQVTLTARPERSLYDADLFSAQWALLLNPGPPPAKSRCRIAIKHALEELCKRLARIAKSGVYRQVTVLVLVPKLFPAVHYIAKQMEQGVGDRCAITVIPAGAEPLEQQVVALIEANGDDFADYVVHIRHNSEALSSAHRDEISDSYERLIEDPQ